MADLQFIYLHDRLVAVVADDRAALASDVREQDLATVKAMCVHAMEAAVEAGVHSDDKPVSGPKHVPARAGALERRCSRGRQLR